MFRVKERKRSEQGKMKKMTIRNNCRLEVIIIHIIYKLIKNRKKEQHIKYMESEVHEPWLSLAVLLSMCGVNNNLFVILHCYEEDTACGTRYTVGYGKI